MELNWLKFFRNLDRIKSFFGNFTEEGFIKILGLFIFLTLLINIFGVVRKKLSGYLGERKVRKFLKNFTDKKSIVINNILLPLYDRTTQVDHIVINSTGITVIETKNYKGRIYGSVNNKHWLQKLGHQYNKFYNPLMQNDTHVNCIKHLLDKEKVTDFSLENVVIFASSKCRLTLDEHNYPIFTFKIFKRWFKAKIKSSTITTDVNKVAEVLKKYEITDPTAKKEHIKYVKRKSMLGKLGI